SYPKSGNTWVRLFLANYLMPSDQPVGINDVARIGTGDAMLRHYHAVSGGRFDSTDIYGTIRLRERVLRGIVGNNADINFVKTHTRRTVVSGIDLFPPQYTKSAIYVIRNPLDMVLSYARHFSMTHEQASEAVCHSDNALAPDAKNVAQFLGSWSDHVASWTSFSAYPVLVLRYEDLLQQPETEFAKLIKHVGATMSAERLQTSIRHSSFDQLKQQEQQQGFIERAPKDESFFTKGQAGVWRDELDPALVKRIKQANKRLMKQYGYWND
ncbi:MAG: sulfotransferase domain-containing protein, partial [Rhodobacteraceae bacterium]|nr:sulfotransferase domain-containing protein [Paracoccaceae bacterium]